MAKLPAAVAQTALEPNQPTASRGPVRRALSVFGMGGWFGPGEPLPPMAPPEEQAIGPRQFDFGVGRNLTMRPRADEAQITPMAALRSVADTYDVARLCIQEIKRQISGHKWEIVSKDQIAGDRTAADPNAGRVDVLRGFWRHPDGVHRFDEWIKMALEEVLVIDALPLFKHRTLGGQLGALEIVAGDTIKVLIDQRGRVPDPPNPAYQQIIKGLVRGQYSRDEMLYGRLNPRAGSAYGQSPTEWCLLAINTALRKQLYELAYYKDGNIPDALLPFPGEKVTPEQIRLFQDYIDTRLKGDSETRRGMTAVPVPGNTTASFRPYEFRQPRWERDLEEWMLQIVCAAYGIAPAEIGFTHHVNRATAQGQENAAERKLTDYLNYLAAIINGINEDEFGERDLAFVWMDTKPEEDTLKMAQVDKLRIETGQRTPDELRQRDGLDSLNEGGDEAFIITASGPVLMRDIAGASTVATTPRPAPVVGQIPVAGKAPVAPSVKLASAEELRRLDRYLAKGVRRGGERRPFRAAVAVAEPGEGDRSAVAAPRE